MARKQFKKTTLRDKLQQYNDIKKIFPKMTLPSELGFYSIRNFIKDASEDLLEEQDTRSVCVIFKFFEKKKVNLDSPAPQEWLAAMLNHKTDDTMKLYVELVAEALPFLESTAEKTAWASDHLRRLAERATDIDAYYEKMSKSMATIGQVVTSLGKKLSHSQNASSPISNHRSFWADCFDFLGPDASGFDTHTCLADMEKFYNGFSILRMDDPIHCRWIDVAQEFYVRDHDTLQLFVDLANEATHCGWSNSDKAQWAYLKTHTICTKVLTMMQLPTPPDSPRMQMDGSKSEPKVTESTSGRATSLSQFAGTTPTTLEPDFGKVKIDFSTMNSSATPFTFGAGSVQPTTPPRRLAKAKSSRLGVTLPDPVVHQSLLSQSIFGSCDATIPTTDQCAAIPSVGLHEQTTTARTPTIPCGLLTLENAAEYKPAISSDDEHRLVVLHVAPLPKPSSGKRAPRIEKTQQHDVSKSDILQALSPIYRSKPKEADLLHREHLVLDHAQAAITPPIRTEAGTDHSLQYLPTSVSGEARSQDADDHNGLSVPEALLTDVMPVRTILIQANTAQHGYDFPSMDVTRPSSIYDDADDSQESFSSVTEPPAPTFQPRLDFPSKSLQFSTLKVAVEPPVVDLESESEPLFTDDEEEDVLDQSLVSDYLALSSLSGSYEDLVHEPGPFDDNVDDELVYKPESLPTLPALENLEGVFADFLSVEKPAPQIPELNLDTRSLEQEYEAALSALDLLPSGPEAYEKIEKELEKDHPSTTFSRASGTQKLEGDRNAIAETASNLPDLPAFRSQNDLHRAITGTITEGFQNKVSSDISSHSPQSSCGIDVHNTLNLSKDANGLKFRNTNNESIKDRQVIEEALPDGSNSDELARFYGRDEPHSDSASEEGLDDLADEKRDNYIRFGVNAKVDDTHGRGALDEDSISPSIPNTGSGHADDSADEASHCCATQGIAPLALLDTDGVCFRDLVSRALSDIVALHAPD